MPQWGIEFLKPQRHFAVHIPLNDFFNVRGTIFVLHSYSGPHQTRSLRFKAGMVYSRQN